MKYLLKFLLPAIFSLPVYAANEVTSYLCIPEQSTGFKLNSDGRWAQTNFSIKHIQYTLKLYESGRWKWFTNNAIEYACSSFNEYGQMACDNITTEIRFNRDTLKFTLFYMTGYAIPEMFVGTELELEENPYIQIGACTPVK